MQLRECKKKLEELPVLRREVESLKEQLEESSMQSGAGTVQHLHSRLARMREEVEDILRQRDEALTQVQLLTAELGQAHLGQQQAREEFERVRRRLTRLEGEEPLTAGVGSPPKVAEAPTLNLPPSPQGRRSGAMDEIRQLIDTQKGDLLERLLCEKERATRAETTLNLQRAETATLSEQRAKDAAQIAALEEKLRSESAQMKELQNCTGGESPKASEDAKIGELQALLLQRERELQIHRWRGRSESDALVAQETLMMSCFHELGLRYQKLCVETREVRRKVGGEHISKVQEAVVAPA